MAQNPKDTFRPEHVAWVMAEDDLEQLLLAVQESVEVVIDLETTGLNEHATRGGATNGGVAARVVLASLTLPMEDEQHEEAEPTTWVLPLSHPDSPWLGQWRQVFRRVAQAIKSSGVAVTNQNMKFDSRWTKATTRVSLADQITWDTRTASHLLDENTPTALKERAPSVFGIERWDDFDLSTPGAAERVPLFDLGLYAARDTYWTWKLARRQRSMMWLEGRDEDDFPMGEERQNAQLGMIAQRVSMPTVRALSRIEERGIKIDVEWCREQLREHEAGRAMLFEELSQRYSISGTPNFAPTALWWRAWTAAAVEAGDLRVASITPQGNPQWGADVLKRQARQGSDLAQQILDLRKHEKLSQFLRAWLGQVSPKGRIHATYHEGRVVTGRLSSSDPNMQQVTYALRPAFVPSDGYLFADLDYSQIELRVAAHISGSKPMIEAFQRGDDLHTLLAAKITGKPVDQVLPGERQAGKSANFGLLYGMGAYGFKEYAETVYGVLLTEDEALAVHQAFFDQWDGVRQWHARVSREASESGEVVSPIGRVRRVPDVWSPNEKRSSDAVRAAINSPVQGFASDLMQIASSLIEGVSCTGAPGVDGARIVATVHDSILVEVAEDRVDEVVSACQEAMTLGVLPVVQSLGARLQVPLVADAKVGTRWGLSDVR